VSVLVFVPLDRATASALRSGTDPGPRPGWAPTTALATSLGPEAVDEEVEFAALSQAGVLALTTTADPLRLVLAAEVGPGQVDDAGEEPGRVVVGGLRWSQVRSVFADEPEAAEAVDRARTAGEVEGLLDAYDLLWYLPDELDRL
jgi:hypothetical protein